VIVDPMVVACVNQRSFSPDDFENAGEGEPVAFKRPAVRWFVELFERRMRNQILYPPRNQRLTYRQVIEEQVRAFARHLLGTQEVYEPFLVR
jgi:CRISPR/Cas system-associated endonuclease Cas1